MLTAFAAGAVLAALADTVMPEAYAEGGPLVAFATSAGFLLAYASRRSTDGGKAAAGEPAGAARGSGRCARRQQHGSHPRDAPSDPYKQGDEMSTALDEMSTAPVEAETAAERWNVDRARTAVEFEVKHLWGLHTVRGRFRSFDGAYILGPGGPELELTIDAASIDTGVAKRDEHLRSPDFLFIELHPQVRFRSTQVTGLGNGDVHVSGELEAVGTTIPHAFDASVRVIDGELEVEATTTVDQRRFGMSEGPLRNVRPPAKLHVKARLVREKPEFASRRSERAPHVERGGSGAMRVGQEAMA
jgi:polyisoprenoid-binding protein YceI